MFKCRAGSGSGCERKHNNTDKYITLFKHPKTIYFPAKTKPALTLIKRRPEKSEFQVMGIQP
jgi:hypothetical protein